MSLQENEIKIVDYLDGTLPPPEKAALEEHCRSCPECRNALQDAQAGQATFKSLTPGNGPDLSRPILERIAQLPRPGSPSQALPLVPILLAAMLALIVAVASLQKAPGPVTLTPGSGQPPIATASAPLLPAPKPPTIFLASSRGTWTGPKVSANEAVPDGATFQTAALGSLEFDLAGTAPHQTSQPQERTRIILLPGSLARLEPDSVTLESGSAWFRVRNGRHPGGFVVQSGDTRLQVTGTSFGVTASGTGLQIDLVEGSVEIRPASGSPRLVQALESARVAISGVTVEPLSATCIRPWKPYLDERQQALVAPLERPLAPAVASASQQNPSTGVATEAVLRVASPTPPQPIEPPAASASELASGTASPAGTGSDSPIDTLLRHQPSPD